MIEALRMDGFPRGEEFWKMLDMLPSSSARHGAKHIGPYALRRRITLRDAVYLASGRECARPRDRVYGMLSIINWGKRGYPMTDYGKPMFDVVRDVLQYGADVDTGLQLMRNLEMDASDMDVLHWIDRQANRTVVKTASIDISPSEFESMVCTPTATRFSAVRLVSESGYHDSGKPHTIVPTNDDMAYWIRLAETGVCRAVVSRSFEEGDWLIAVSSVLQPAHCGKSNLVFGLVLRDSMPFGYLQIVGKAIMTLDCFDALGCAPSHDRQLFFDPGDFIVFAAQLASHASTAQPTSVAKLAAPVLETINKSGCRRPTSSFALFRQPATDEACG